MKRLYHVDAMRGLAAVAVMWFHFTRGAAEGLREVGAAGALVAASGRWGWLGVEVFFVISGFILPYTMAKAGYGLRDAGTFVRKRVVRLDPPYIAAIALTLGLWWLSAQIPSYGGVPFELEPLRLLLHLGYVNVFFGYEWYADVFWTLAIEFQFYLLIAALFPVLFHRSRGIAIVGLAVLCGSAFLLPSVQFVFHYLGLFGLGIVTAHYALGRLPLGLYLALLALVAAATVPATGAVIAGVGLVSALGIAFVRIPRIAVLEGLGAVSYSLYLVHLAVGSRVVNLGGRFADTLLLHLLVLVGAVGVSFLTAYALYRFVELPSRRWSSSIRYRGAPALPQNPQGPDRAVQGAELSAP